MMIDTERRGGRIQRERERETPPPTCGEIGEVGGITPIYPHAIPLSIQHGRMTCTSDGPNGLTTRLKPLRPLLPCGGGGINREEE